jgi:hypothetical protein
VDVQEKGYRKKSPWGQWVQYEDKRGRGLFYYNLVRVHLPLFPPPSRVMQWQVSRQSQWDEPKDFHRVAGAEIKMATYGMNFYH